ncbi:MAG: choice-of-anchor L domain-containing protein [Bacteroidota bacterium]
MKKQIIALFFLLFFGLPLFAQLTTTSGIGMTPLQLVQNYLVGSGVTVSNVKFNDSPNTITISNQIGSFLTGSTPTNLGFGNGLTISTGGIDVATNGALSVGINGAQITSDAQLQALKPGKSLHDVARLEFDFIPSSDTVKFRYVFASNEYLTAVCTDYDDVFGFFISGVNPAGGNYVNSNIALVPGTNFPVSINTVNGGVSMGSSTPCYLNYTQYYHTFSQNLTYRGATVPLTAWAKVVPCTTYHIKIAICDISNAIYDSGVFLEANSFTSSKVLVSHTFSNPAVSDTMMIRGCDDAIIKLKLPSHLNVNYPIQIIKQGTAVNGVDYPAIPDTIVIPANTDSLMFTISPYNNSSFTTFKYIQLLIKTSACNYDTLTIGILPNLPLIANTTSDTTICGLTQVAISASGSGGIQPYFFSWENGDTNTQRLVNPSVTTLYHLSLSDKCNQTAKDSVLVSVYPALILTLSASPNPICLGQSVQLNAAGAQTYNWTSNISDASLSTQNTLSNPLVMPGATTIYSVIGSDSHSCHATDTIVVMVYPPINPAIVANPNPVSIFDPTIHFTAVSTGGTSWIWDFGDASYSMVSDFYHTYSNANAQNYFVTLFVSNADGCTDSTSITIVVYPDIKLYIPNAFTPCYQSLNNVFKAYGEGVFGFEMTIYDRWGQLIFTSNQIEIGWDGQFQYKDAPQGTYIYALKYKDFLGNTYKRTGSLSLIR